MKFEDIQKSMEKKLGKENSALIADDFATLITYNSEREKTIKDNKEEIDRLKKDKDMLINANGNLLQQINQESEEIFAPKVKEEEKPKEPFNFRNMFDEKGNFKKHL